jgi:hypothetical protein
MVSLSILSITGCYENLFLNLKPGLRSGIWVKIFFIKLLA